MADEPNFHARDSHVETSSKRLIETTVEDKEHLHYSKKTKVGGEEKQQSSNFSSELSLETIRKLQEKFANDRNWNQFHSPRNLLLALVGEVGELSEIFQWKGEVPQGLPNWSVKEKEHLGEELSDVLIYLVRLADKCDIDLPCAVLRKFEKNACKYPAALVSGSNKKYTEYEEVNGKSYNSSHENDVDSPTKRSIETTGYDSQCSHSSKIITAISEEKSIII